MTYKTNGNGRATNIEELQIVFEKFFDVAHEEMSLAFNPRPTDIIISPYTKSGTTWLQQITHGLRTRGSMDFEEISNVIPWIELAYDMGWDLTIDQIANPRLFKSHTSYHDVPKGCRYICSFRHPYDVLVSFYRFFEGWFFEPGTIDLETLTYWRCPRDQADIQGYWYHLTSWWEQRHNPNVLLLCYEDMKADLPGTVQKIACFMGIELDDELLDIVVRQSSRGFMLAHKHQFNEAPIRKICEKRAGLPAPIDSSKVTPGASKQARYQLTPTIKEHLDNIWQDQVQSRFGFKNYDELRRALREIAAS